MISRPGRPSEQAAQQLLSLARPDIAAPFLSPLPHVASTTPDAYLPVIGASMAGVVETLRVFARQEETILLSGPTGAGKSRLARWCHEQSAQRGQLFETLDLSTVPETLQMAELVGWKKGAFTGAVKDTPGALTRSDGGTLFIDEIDKLSLNAQSGLLRVLDERRYRMLGEGRERSTVVRFMAGTNTDLHAAVRTGRFREDLYYRINVLPIRVPPLAERRDEIPEWADFMLERAGARARRASLTDEAKQALLTPRWPGNLRQLDNIVRRSCALSMKRLSASTDELRIEACDVQQALASEADGGQGPLVDLFLATAASFVAEAERRRASGSALDLDLADALRGFVLGTAALKLGSKEEALRLLGKGSVVQSRNHHKALKREMERVGALFDALGDAAGNPFVALSEGEDR